MKKLCVFYGNCQVDGVVHFLKKTRMADEWDFAIWHNWQILMKEQPLDGLLADLKRSPLVIYQPCQGYTCTDGTQIPGTRELLDEQIVHWTAISFSYQFNYGLFPLLNVSPGPDGWITAALLKQKVWGPANLQRTPPIIPHLPDVFSGIKTNILRDYNAGLLHFDCARRFVECLAEQSRREQTTDIKMVPFILSSYRHSRLFLTQNHLTSPMFGYLALQILQKIYGSEDLDIDVEMMRTKDDNEAGMNGVMPVHQAVVDELGLEYPASEGAHEYYRDLLEKMIAGK